MKVAFISGHEAFGGSERGMQRLLAGLAPHSEVSTELYVDRIDLPNSSAQRFTDLGLPGALAQRSHALRHTGTWMRYQAKACKTQLLTLLRKADPDVIHVHNINQWTGSHLTRDIVADLAEIAPVVWTHHDLWGLSGCCDYPEDCRHNPAECGWSMGPRLLAGEAIDHPRAAEWQRIRAVGPRLVHACTSQWNATNVRQIFGPEAAVEVVPLDLDTRLFHPSDRSQARQVLGLPDDRPLVAAVASNLSVRRKGLRVLLEAMHQVVSPCRLLMMGQVKEADRQAFPTDTQFLGEIQDDRMLQQAYAAADLVVVPSLAEAFGQILIEAMACGIPSIAFAVGGMPEVLQQGEDGWLVPVGDVPALAGTIQDFLQGRLAGQQEILHHLRTSAVERFSLGHQAEAYLEIYRGLCTKEG